MLEEPDCITVKISEYAAFRYYQLNIPMKCINVWFAATVFLMETPGNHQTHLRLYSICR